MEPMRPAEKSALSVYHDLKTRFESGSLMGVPYQVLGEQELRAEVTPRFPFVYLLNVGIQFQVQHLPVIVIHPTCYRATLELGNTAHMVDLNLHIFGRDRGQRYALPGAISEQVESFNLYDFVPGPVLVGEAKLEEDQDGLLWKPSESNLGRELALEGSLANWVTISALFWAIGL